MRPLNALAEPSGVSVVGDDRDELAAGEVEEAVPRRSRRRRSPRRRRPCRSRGPPRSGRYPTGGGSRSCPVAIAGRIEDGPDVLEDVVEVERGGVGGEERGEREAVSLIAAVRVDEAERVADLALPAAAGVLEVDLEREGAGRSGVEHEDAVLDAGDVEGAAVDGLPESGVAVNLVGVDIELGRERGAVRCIGRNGEHALLTAREGEGVGGELPILEIVDDDLSAHGHGDESERGEDREGGHSALWEEEPEVAE